jgi:hypothetical protein
MVPSGFSDKEFNGLTRDLGVHHRSRLIGGALRKGNEKNSEQWVFLIHL